MVTRNRLPSTFKLLEAGWVRHATFPCQATPGAGSVRDMNVETGRVALYQGTASAGPQHIGSQRL
jgi:hypothetical protein